MLKIRQKKLKKTSKDVEGMDTLATCFIESKQIYL